MIEPYDESYSIKSALRDGHDWSDFGDQFTDGHTETHTREPIPNQEFGKNHSNGQQPKKT